MVNTMIIYMENTKNSGFQALSCVRILWRAVKTQTVGPQESGLGGPEYARV